MVILGHDDTHSNIRTVVAAAGYISIINYRQVHRRHVISVMLLVGIIVVFTIIFTDTIQHPQNASTEGNRTCCLVLPLKALSVEMAGCPCATATDTILVRRSRQNVPL